MEPWKTHTDPGRRDRRCCKPALLVPKLVLGPAATARNRKFIFPLKHFTSKSHLTLPQGSVLFWKVRSRSQNVRNWSSGDQGELTVDAHPSSPAD